MSSRVLGWLALIGSAVGQPALPYIDKSACPFEGCAYREWTARTDVPTFDSWQEPRKQSGVIRKGEKIAALGGVVVTFRPGVIHVDRDVATANLRRGDTILTYSYLGEGFSKAWVNGRFHEMFDISFTKWPDGTGCGGAHCAATYIDLGEKVWWAEVKLKSGMTAWVLMEDYPFDGTSRLAER